jgi:hypothetical protein
VDELNKKKRFYALLKEQLFGLVAFPDTCLVPLAGGCFSLFRRAAPAW